MASAFVFQSCSQTDERGTGSVMNGDIALGIVSQDVDDETDDMLFRDSATLSKGRIRRLKTISAILGSKNDEMNY